MPRLRKAMLAGGALGAGAAAVLAYGVWVEPARLRVERVSAAIGKGPPLRLALISDLHLPTFLGDEDKVLAALERERPDLVLVAGDVRNHRRGYAEGEAFLARLSGRWETILVMGDADQCSDHGQCHYCRSRYVDRRPLPWRVLRNEGLALPRHNLMVYGIDDPTSDLDDTAFASAPDSAARRLLLVHSTHKLTEDFLGRFDLVLAGNTHGGQIAFLRPILRWYDTTLDVRYLGGAYRVGKALLVVSRGIGTSRYPIRLGVPPELVVLDVR